MTSENVDPSLIIEILNSIKTEKIKKNRNKKKKELALLLLTSLIIP